MKLMNKQQRRDRAQAKALRSYLVAVPKDEWVYGLFNKAAAVDVLEAKGMLDVQGRQFRLNAVGHDLKVRL